jgi:N-methylhydantoinase B
LASTERAVDPFVIEIVQDALVAIADEMFVTTQRTSQSTIIYEVLDFAVGLTDPRGDLIIQGNGITLFLATLADGVRSVIDKFGPDGVYEGDIFMTNDPYVGGGTHLSDVTIITPVFFKGEILAYAANKAHWTEVGGRDPGSVSTEVTEIYQEGLQFPPVKIFERGAPNEALFDVIRANVRVPDMSIGDLHAQAASVRLAARRFAELCEKHGTEVIAAAIERMMSHSAQLARHGLEKLPPGVYEAEDWLDNDRAGEGPYRVCVKVTIGPESFVCDFTGTHPQLLSSMNCSRTGLMSGARMIYKALVVPSAPLSEGTFELLDVICPSGTVFTCERPTPTSVYWEALIRAADLVWRAVAEVLPDRTTSGHFLSICADLIAGPHPETGELFILFEPNPGGWGAGVGKDGERALVSIGDGETFMIPVEVAEIKYGVLVEQYALNVTGAGAGKWRGGEGIVRDYRITAETATATITCGRHEFAPWGIDGGHDGSRNEVQFLHADGREPYTTGMISRYPLQRSDVVRMLTGTGGGWGDPLERDPSLVAADVRNGFVTVEQAGSVYGVDVDPETFAVRGFTSARG